MLNRIKDFTLKNGEFMGSIDAHQSGYAGGMPARINSDSEVARAYSDTGYIGVFANGSAGQGADQSGDPATYYYGPGIFTLEKDLDETAFPYDSTQTYAAGEGVGIVAGVWSNNSPSTVRARVLGVGTVSGGVTTSLTVQML